MEPFAVFSARDLRLRSGELLDEAEAGRVSLITKHGRPAFVAVPFDQRLLDHGLHRAMALHFFESRKMSLAQAAKLAGLAAEEFVELLGQAGLDAVSYSAEDLEAEVKAAS